MKKKKIFILLTQFPDNGSKLVKAMTGFKYTHASIGLEEDMNTFYTFTVKGFFIEKVTGYLRPDREPFPCRLYELDVPEKVYNKIKDEVRQFINKKSEMSYSYTGLIMSLFKIPYKRKNRYICSQFVAEILEKAKVIKLEKDSCLYLPGDFTDIPDIHLAFQGNLFTLTEKYGLLPCF